MSARAFGEGTGRLMIGLVVDVARGLESHGPGPFEDGRSYVELHQHPFHPPHGGTYRHRPGRVA